ncbi:MAG TPA: ATP-binding protein [Kofleriaceae bacterium]|nr:ATP-binding protein [Kofleriaceae bacterium]
MIAGLDSGDWRQVLDAVTSASAWVQAITPGDARIGTVVARLVALAGHPKWEVRRAVAHAAAQTLHGDFEAALARMSTDHNARVRQAAEAAALRRRDWANASALGRQHEGHINATLDDIEARFGARGRAAVKRASEHIANTFARELYHEVIRLLSPLATSADRLVVRLGEGGVPREKLVDEASRMKGRIGRLRSVLDGMRAYTAQPDLRFQAESVREVVDESVALVREGQRKAPRIHVDVPPDLHADVCRARMVQALTNLLANAIESYEGQEKPAPIAVTARATEHRVEIAIEDRGAGMSEEVLADATVLFSTSKPDGTGFGLPLAVKIVESEHDGRLSLESRKGHGTTVRVVVPIHRQRERS